MRNESSGTGILYSGLDKGWPNPKDLPGRPGNGGVLASFPYPINTAT